MSHKNNLCVGILAHVDAGKTTLSEAMLYVSGTIRRAGRVDNGDAFLDTEELERARGITIFSKQAVMPLGSLRLTLLDTPACGFLGGDGADAAGFRLCDSCHKRSGRRAGTHEDALEASCALPCSGLFIRQ